MTDHHPDCAWERATCEYKATHYYCPHPEHACTCPPAPKAGPVTDLNIPALREAVAKMTEGPWCRLDHNGSIITGLGDLVIDETENDADADGIVALRNAAPALLDEVKRLRSSVESAAVGLGRSRVDRIAELEEREKTLVVFANAALRQRHAEAVEAAFREGYNRDTYPIESAWLASEAKARLT